MSGFKEFELVDRALGTWIIEHETTAKGVRNGTHLRGLTEGERQGQIEFSEEFVRQAKRTKGLISNDPLLVISQWVLSSERLPDEDQEVQFINTQIRKPDGTIISGNVSWGFHRKGGFHSYVCPEDAIKATHWMPSTKAPCI